MGQTASQPTPSLEPKLPPGHPPIGAAPPPGCPMHASSPPAQCPVPHAPSASASTSAAQCPVAHDKLNPLNQMPTLAQSPAPNQRTPLPLERTVSSIPRPPSPEPDAPGRWEYPSPQQFYNALVRKGWETPEESVESMVEIHNFLNEAAWGEVLKWEARNPTAELDKIELSRFMGKPGQLSPKARVHLLAAYFFPSRFSAEPPFDRHDWVVRRPWSGEEVRYVIDYYSAPPEPDGSPVFSLDVRPALDSVGSIKERIVVAAEGAWRDWKKEEKDRH
ncbi:cytochrome c heme lyase [Calocera viscosa TUFC12733]|uniref:Holocytochrome c-type synthase n=1 Tax=Calocera viscosa (strain TUFC12733) TaxID=1330018 RepID=A0A167RYW8_CALVF|nr:cytochrome c heme lyase [Calocera viscosa TUFC12733]